MKDVIFPVVLFLHNLFTTTWVGGLVLMVVAILPALKKNERVKEPKIAIKAIQDRLKWVAIISMIGLAITGILLSNRAPDFERLFAFGTPYLNLLSVKHILMVVMVALAGARLGLNKRNEKTPSKGWERVSAAVLVLNALCALAVLFLSGMISTL